MKQIIAVLFHNKLRRKKKSKFAFGSYCFYNNATLSNFRFWPGEMKRLYKIAAIPKRLMLLNNKKNKLKLNKDYIKQNW